MTKPVTGRYQCQCGGQIITVRVDTRDVRLDWPRSDTGTYAVWHTSAGGWRAEYAAPGERVLPPYYRYRVHACPLDEPPQDLTEPLHEPQLDTWRKAEAAHAKEKRGNRWRRPAKPVTGYRVPPP